MINKVYLKHVWRMVDIYLIKFPVEYADLAKEFAVNLCALLANTLIFVLFPITLPYMAYRNYKKYGNRLWKE